MNMRIIKKSDCIYKNGRIIKGDEVIGLPLQLADQLNDLETRIQASAYMDAQPKAAPMPSIDGFKRKSIKDAKKYEVATPKMDEQIALAKEIMREADKLEDCKALNELVDKYDAVFEFIDDDDFIEGDAFDIIDTPTLGNPLELTRATVLSAIDADGFIAREE